MKVLYCSRHACKLPLDDLPHYLIYNEPSTGIPRPYCVSCGRKIMEYNRSQPQDIQLKAETVDRQGVHRDVK
jgi:hypothetical protein